MKIIKIGALWCPGCLIVNKALKEVKKQYDIEVIDKDYDMDDIESYSVGDVLPVLIFPNGKRLVGERNKNEIIDMIKEVLNEK